VAACRNIGHRRGAQFGDGSVQGHGHPGFIPIAPPLDDSIATDDKEVVVVAVVIRKNTGLSTEHQDRKLDAGVDGKNVDLVFATVPGVDGHSLDLINGIGIDEGLRTGGQIDATHSAISHDKHDDHFAGLFIEGKIATAATELEYLQIKVRSRRRSAIMPKSQFMSVFLAKVSSIKTKSDLK
jgi:hypothetical protein